MSENKYLNEKKYQKAERKLTLVAILVLIIGLSIGGYLLYKGLAKPESHKVETLKAELESQKQALEASGITFDITTEYSDGKAYDLKIITEALDPSFNHCSFEEYKDNSLTKEYCSAKNSISDFSSSAKIMLGAFICIATCMISGSILMTAKGRHILAFQAQQVMPVAKEGIDEMAPTIGNVASEITKGIKKGLEDDEK